MTGEQTFTAGRRGSMAVYGHDPAAIILLPALAAHPPAGSEVGDTLTWGYAVTLLISLRPAPPSISRV